MTHLIWVLTQVRCAAPVVVASVTTKKMKMAKMTKVTTETMINKIAQTKLNVIVIALMTIIPA